MSLHNVIVRLCVFVLFFFRIIIVLGVPYLNDDKLPIVLLKREKGHAVAQNKTQLEFHERKLKIIFCPFLIG